MSDDKSYFRDTPESGLVLVIDWQDRIFRVYTEEDLRDDSHYQALRAAVAYYLNMTGQAGEKDMTVDKRPRP